MPPTIVKLNQLDSTILTAVKNFSGGKIPGVKGPIINGIIIKESALGTIKPLTVAKEITKSIPLEPGVTLVPTAQAIGDKRWIVGFKIQTKI
jgi:hypothetical protein